MEIVILTALGIGAATVIGAYVGYVFRDSSRRFLNIIFYISSVIMLFSAIFGLVLPSYECARGREYIAFLGMAAGIFCILLIELLIPKIQKRSMVDSGRGKNMRRAIVMMLAMAIHNFPEGMAAGVGLCVENLGMAVLIVGGIALQNIPEGMVVISPMLCANISPKKCFLAAFATGMCEVLGTFFGYFASSVSDMMLPYILAFAGGTMLYVVIKELLVEALKIKS